ncbi:MAG: TraR/DksA family transcriptional regulator [Bdellovibrionaceae bacterium]|nr:TraR/DksA family transcriptional regulator [Pseudobdellovibrionaceae bacterium]MDW8189824.1 TraR/DksA family transcriptional regulator [Pseudobdellovibrionaceae bacterium]
MMNLPKEVIEACRKKLIDTKEALLNQITEARNAFYMSDEKGGDEADQTLRILAESEFLNRTERIRLHLLEVESALARIEAGTFGICEETEEPIEKERLLAIPWTRLSIEGAEIRESMKKRFAR